MTRGSGRIPLSHPLASPCRPSVAFLASPRPSVVPAPCRHGRFPPCWRSLPMLLRNGACSCAFVRARTTPPHSRLPLPLLPPNSSPGKALPAQLSRMPLFVLLKVLMLIARHWARHPLLLLLLLLQRVRSREEDARLRAAPPRTGGGGATAARCTLLSALARGDVEMLAEVELAGDGGGHAHQRRSGAMHYGVRNPRQGAYRQQHVGRGGGQQRQPQRSASGRHLRRSAGGRSRGDADAEAEAEGEFAFQETRPGERQRE